MGFNTYNEYLCLQILICFFVLFFRVLLCVFVVFCVSVYSVYCLSSMDLCGLN